MTAHPSTADPSRAADMSATPTAPAPRRVFGVVGWKNAGKTTLVERLVAEIVGRGVSVATVKHAHHVFDVDHEGKDSWRHRQAGAQEVLVASAVRWALMAELRGAEEPPLDALLAKLSPVDLVLVEGFKRDRHPKLEARRLGGGAGPALYETDPKVRAIAGDDPKLGEARPDLPFFHLDDVTSIATFILRDVGLMAAMSTEEDSDAEDGG